MKAGSGWHTSWRTDGCRCEIGHTDQRQALESAFQEASRTPRLGTCQPGASMYIFRLQERRHGTMICYLGAAAKAAQLLGIRPGVMLAAQTFIQAVPKAPSPRMRLDPS